MATTTSCNNNSQQPLMEIEQKTNHLHIKYIKILYGQHRKSVGYHFMPES